MRLSILSTVCMSLLLISACSSDQLPEQSTALAVGKTNPMVDANVAQNPETAKGHKQFRNVDYSATMLNAIDFLEKKGESVEEADREDLSKEWVLVLTLNAGGQKSIFEDPRLTLEKDDAVQYLSGEVLKDIHVEQEGKELSPTGSQFEYGSGKTGQLRLFVYFRDIDRSGKLQAVYYDRLFGAGMMRFTI